MSVGFLLTVEVPQHDRDHQARVAARAARPGLAVLTVRTDEPRFLLAGRRTAVCVEQVAVIALFTGIDMGVATPGRARLGRARVGVLADGLLGARFRASGAITVELAIVCAEVARLARLPDPVAAPGLDAGKWVTRPAWLDLASARAAVADACIAIIAGFLTDLPTVTTERNALLSGDSALPARPDRRAV